MEKTNEINSDTPMFTLGVTSRLSNLPAHSIRQYIDNGLLVPYKLKSKRQLFSQRDINRLKNIHALIHEKGLNFAGIRALMAMVPCWAIRECPEESRQSCQAYLQDSRSCWDASEKATVCRNEDCRRCEVYKKLSVATDLKSFIREKV